MDDMFMPRRFQIAIGVSQTSVIADLNYDDSYEFEFIKYENQAARDAVSLMYIEPPKEIAFSVDSNKESYEVINFPDGLFDINLEEKKLVYNRHFA